MKKYIKGFKFLTKSGPAEIKDIDSENALVHFIITGNVEMFPVTRLRGKNINSLKDNEGDIYCNWRSEFSEWVDASIDFNKSIELFKTDSSIAMKLQLAKRTRKLNTLTTNLKRKYSHG